MKRDDLIKTAEGIMEVIPCDPTIPTDEDTEDEDILNGIKEASELIEDTDVDSFDEEVIENLKKLKCWNPIVTKAKKTTKKAPEPEPEVEEEDEEPPVKAPAKKVVAKKVVEEEEEDEEPPVKKTAGKTQPIPTKKEKAAPAKKEKVVKEKKEKAPVYGRVDAVSEALLDAPKSVAEWVKAADAAMLANKQKANPNEAKFIIRYIQKMAPHFDFGVKVPME